MQRRSRQIYYAVTLAVMALVTWGLSRVVLCWGAYGLWGGVLCHLNILTYVALIVGAVALLLFVRELGRPDDDGQRPRGNFEVQAARAHFRMLAPADRRHAWLSAALLLTGLIGVAWLVFFSPIRF